MARQRIVIIFAALLLACGGFALTAGTASAAVVPHHAAYSGKHHDHGHWYHYRSIHAAPRAF